jgi:hypothetical protein
MKVIAERLGIKSESTAFNMLLTVKRRFKTTLRTNLQITVISENDIDEEWHEMLDFFRKTQQNSE